MIVGFLFVEVTETPNDTYCFAPSGEDAHVRVTLETYDDARKEPAVYNSVWFSIRGKNDQACELNTASYPTDHFTEDLQCTCNRSVSLGKDPRRFSILWPESSL